MDQAYMEAVRFFPPGIRTKLEQFPAVKQEGVREICLRAERPLAVCRFDGPVFLGENGQFSSGIPARPYRVKESELAEFLRILTGYSLHSYEQEIRAGFLTVQGGHRAGLAGSCIWGQEGVRTVREISSVTFRIARQVRGCASVLLRRLFQEGLCSVLIAGPPASGKTTLLKDLARGLSDGETGRPVKVSLIDERGELAAVCRGIPQNDVGVMTDVFDGYPKEIGMLQAIRAMTPQAIVLDEIAGEAEMRSIRQCLNAGAAVIASIHASTLDELMSRPLLRELFQTGAFRRIVLLKGAGTPGEVSEIFSPKELVLC